MQVTDYKAKVLKRHPKARICCDDNPYRVLICAPGWILSKSVWEENEEQAWEDAYKRIIRKEKKDATNH